MDTYAGSAITTINKILQEFLNILKACDQNNYFFFFTPNLGANLPHVFQVLRFSNIFYRFILLILRESIVLFPLIHSSLGPSDAVVHRHINSKAILKTIYLS